MDRARLREFRQVRWGAVKPHWTDKDFAEYENWLGRRAANPSRDVEARRREYFAFDWRELIVAFVIIAGCVAVLVPTVRAVKEAAHRADQLNAKNAPQVDRTP